MIKTEEKFLEERKKISLNIDKKILELVNDLAKITKTNKTIILEAFMHKGIVWQLKHIEESWKNMKKNKSINQKKLNEALSGLNSLKIKHKNFLEKLKE